MQIEENEQITGRKEKLKALLDAGEQPYGAAFDVSDTLGGIVEAYAEARPVRAAGRLMAKRGHGKMCFADIRDVSGKLQFCIKKDLVDESTFDRFKELDLGDIVGLEGELFKTKTGEVTLQVKQLTLLAKALRPLPEKWHGLKDVEVRYRKRYLDLAANPESQQVFVKRAQVIRSMRRTLEDQGFIEVETPMMHAIPGGAAGEPFITHHNALDMDLFMRLAPELYLKMLLVGGMDKVYELNRSFRNEGLSTRHNPEFTMLEVYQAFSDCKGMMELVQELICKAAQEIHGSLTFEYKGQTLDLNPPWEVVSFSEAMAEMGLKADSPPEQMKEVLTKHGIKVGDMSRSQLVRLVEQIFDPRTKSKPLFVVDYWTEISPLAKSKVEDPAIADRFELFIGGMEVANAYSELNDPIEQRKRFEAQLAGLDAGEAQKRCIDDAFVEALEHGMPPAGGLGVGIDRIAMLLLDRPSIKDVLLFPLLRPLVEDKESNESDSSQ